MAKQTKVLLIGDNGEAPWHPLEPARAELEVILGDEFELAVTEDYEQLAGLERERYAAVISYTDCWRRKLPAEQTAGLIRFVAGGGGLLAIHNGISLQASYELAQLIGGKFTDHPPYQPLNYIGATGGHPLLEGVPDFTVDEEPYLFEFDAFTPRNVFLEYEFEGKRYPAAWEHTYGLGKAVYLQPGHNAGSFKPEAYRTLIRNSLRWVTAQAE
ncbi:ThuA domain-containing protein [Paenibacillus arenilitoris]|uniref:ThuA domain-containing protein n=1 Tax=Paenibacillus arenilitoris TaxID=2772299 RepID=A0A927H4C5_9BACL|nr:ThuA domain-containing protein [Paenibacillus arenilitoris]MBD2867333.1 ThuA domain-containing protein [Paenibacillus arenilitoris]